ncbi:MAG: SRPBCC domain-containing protein [Actinomycetales bacterium]
MSEPLRLAFDVACAPEHAFSVWTTQIGSWWPRDHTLSGAPEAIVLERGVGGRIFERTSDGVEHDWGQVTVWEPPQTLGYLWHIGRQRDQATEVQIQFVPSGAGATRVEIEHRGWERLGTEGEQYRTQNVNGWQTLVPHFTAAATAGDAR